MPEPASHDHDRHHADADDKGAPDMASLLDLDAVVLADYWTAALDWVQAALAGSDETSRLLDLGAGTGTAAIGLAQRFPAAEVVAVDISAESLDRLRVKAAETGLGSRLRVVVADLDTGWPETGRLDLTWASMSLHHVADPHRVLGDARDATRDGGLIAVAEFAEPLRFLPDDLGVGRPGFEDRVATVFGRAHIEALPTLGSAWAPRLTAAGWTVVDERDFRIDLDPTEHPLATAYARGWFTRLAHGLADRLDVDDRATLEALLDESGPSPLLERTRLWLRGVRTVTIARRPD
jgi:SAM-dependent methyltransferase